MDVFCKSGRRQGLCPPRQRAPYGNGGRPQAAPTRPLCRLYGRPLAARPVGHRVSLRHSERPFCHSERSEESVTPVFVRDRNTPSVTFGDSSLGEGAKDEGCGFDRLRPQNDRVRAWFFFVWGATTRRAKRPRMATAGGRRPPLRMRPKDGVGAAFGRPPGRAPRFPPSFRAPFLSF